MPAHRPSRSPRLSQRLPRRASQRYSQWRLPRTAAFLAGSAAVATVLAACSVDFGSGGDDNADAADGGDGAVSVVASTPMWADIAERVGGDDVTVDSVIPAGTDPHDFQSSPADGLAITDADLLVYNGGGYDDFFAELVDSTGSDAPVIDAYDESATIRLPGLGHEPGQDPNEHVWFSFDTVGAVADTVADELSDIDPDHAEGFYRRADALHEQVADLADQADEIAADSPGAVVSTEPVAHYLLLQAGIDDATPTGFSEAVEEDSDPAPADVSAMRDLIEDGDVDALVYNTDTDSAVTRSIRSHAEDHDVTVVEVAETPPEGTPYTEWTAGILTELGEATTGR